MPNAPKPTVGRIVHFTSVEPDEPPHIEAAIVTSIIQTSSVVDPDLVSLRVFQVDGSDRHALAEHTDEPAGSESARGYWSWPARVESGGIDYAIRAKQAITVLYDRRGNRPIAETIEDLMDLVVVLTEFMCLAERERSK